jgi:hypothetical protein
MADDGTLNRNEPSPTRETTVRSGAASLAPAAAAPGPAERAAAVVQDGAGAARAQVLGHRLAAGDDLDQHDRVLALEQPPHVRPPLLDLPALEKIIMLNERGDLLHRHLRVGGGEASRGHVPELDLRLERVHVDVVDGGAVRRPVDRRDPGDV